MLAPMRHEVLVVDDDPEFRTLVRTLLAGSGFCVNEAANGKAALMLIERRPFDVLIMDIVMSDGEGLETIHAVRKRDFKCPILAISGVDSRSVYLKTARLLGADLTLEKPIGREELYASLNRLVCAPVS
jgi:DNA-binding response OmpR family regulator